MSKPKVKNITTIEIDIDGKLFKLTIDQAKALHAALGETLSYDNDKFNEILDKLKKVKEKEYIPYPQPYPIPWDWTKIRPYRPYWTREIWCHDTSNDTSVRFTCNSHE